jgi:uncharacterized protein YdhG (YjbR/CyaY superfamily)
MAKTGFKTVEEYLATFPDSVREVLRTVRLAIREAVPDAEEVISYQVPAYRFHGWLLYFAGFKKHYSLFCPQPDSLLETFQAELSGYEVSKSTIKFPLDQPVPVELIRNMAKHRAAEYRSREKPRREQGASRPRSCGEAN